MIEHGITTTEASWWFILCPLHSSPLMGGVKRGLYAVNVEVFRRQASLYQLIDARSKDKTTTGRGHLVPMPNPIIEFISDNLIPPEPEWVSLTDREAGMEAEDMVRWMIIHGRAAKITETIIAGEKSYNYDLILWPSQQKAEIKCDRKAAETGNLFIQTHEAGHNPIIDRDGHIRSSRLY